MREFIDRRELRRKAADILRYASSEQDPIEMAKTMVSLIDNAPAVAKAMDVHTTQGWISVEGRLPEPKVPVLLRVKGSPYSVTCSDYDIAVYDPNVYQPFWQYVTHWMPLPQPPAD